MAEVHLARASGFEGFEKLLVLKRILPHLAADKHFVQMFLAEARLAALLQHPNIVQVYDLGKEETNFFFTMEFVYGENAYAISRAARKRGEALPIEHAISIIIGAASGLHYAHERVGMDGRPLGIVHRDVSPTNLMVTYDGCPKVADFGIAKVTNRTDVTQAGIRKGKVPYMSPEQCKAARVDRRSDVFALGICLYELSTGTRLFDGDNEFGVMNRIVTGDVPLPSTVRASYPVALERIVMRALSTDINARFPTCLHMQHELEAMVRDARIDASASSLARWMHHVFKPQPFPWGALQGDGVTGGGGARPTIADSGGGARPGDVVSRPDMTPHSGVGSYPMPSSATSGLMPSSAGPAPSSLGSGTRAGPRTSAGAANDGGTLKGIAMGLGIVAAIAVASVAWLVMYKQTGGGTEPETAGAQTPATAEADELVPSPDPSADPAPVADAPPPPPSAAEVPPVEEAPDVVPAAAPAEDLPETVSEPEEVIELIDEPEPTKPEPEPEPTKPEPTKPKTSKPKASKPKTSKPKTSKPKKKPKGDGGSAPDGFWGD